MTDNATPVVKRKKTQKDFYHAKPEQYLGYYKNFVKRLQDQGISMRKKYPSVAASQRNYEYRSGTLRMMKYTFGNKHLI